MKKKILYAEDDHDILEVVREFMKFGNYDVVTDNGQSIKEKLLQHAIGLILLDEHLSWGRGSNLCQALKSDPKTAHIPVVLISALTNVDEIAATCGADGYIRKPFDIDEVIDTVDQYYHAPPR